MGVRTSRFVATLAAALLTAPLVARAGAQDSTGRPKTGASLAYRYRILGIFDLATGDPIAGVQVSDVLSGTSAMTTVTGTVSLFFLPDGGSLVRLRKVGYEMQTVPISISPADTTPLTLMMSKAVELPTVVVKDSATKHGSPAIRGFDERRARGIGQFIPESELRKHDEQPLANVITAHMNGLMAVRAADKTNLVSTRKQCSGPALSGCRAPNCWVRVYLDGALYSDSNSPAASRMDFGRITANDYAAIEFYPGGASMPMEYSGTGADCGTLLLWSRER